jgi:hypothetical protein
MAQTWTPEQRAAHSAKIKEVLKRKKDELGQLPAALACIDHQF